MRILCGISGVDFNCDHFPGVLKSRETVHPIFNVPQRKLIPYARKWSAGELTEVDTYLYFLALLNSTDLVDFRVPVKRTERTQSIIAINMDPLLRAIWKISSVNHPGLLFPRYAIGPDTADLSTVEFWINNWLDIYSEFQNGARRDYETRKRVQQEAIIERLIKNPYKPVSSYSGQLAAWAEIAGEFPTFVTLDHFTGSQVSCAAYWKECISRAASPNMVLSVPLRDYQELLEHCEDNIPIGSVFSNALFKLLRHAVECHKDFLGLLPASQSNPRFTIIDNSNKLESSLLENIRNAAPLAEPKRQDYPSQLAYLKARFAWQKASQMNQDPPKES